MQINLHYFKQTYEHIAKRLMLVMVFIHTCRQHLKVNKSVSGRGTVYFIMPGGLLKYSIFIYIVSTVQPFTKDIKNRLFSSGHSKSILIVLFNLKSKVQGLLYKI